MNNLIEEILLSDTGQRMVDIVSEVYNDAFVGLWLYEAIGREYDRIDALIEDLVRQERPETATWALTYWEERYGLPIGTGTIEERRAAIARKRANAKPFTPARLEMLLSSTFGRPAKVYENIAPYTFGAYFISSGTVELIPVDYGKAQETIRKAKQSHLSFELGFQLDITVKIGVSGQYWRFLYERTGTAETGTLPDVSMVGGSCEHDIRASPEAESHIFPYSFSGTVPDINMVGDANSEPLNANTEASGIAYPYPLCGTGIAG